MRFHNYVSCNFSSYPHRSFTLMLLYIVKGVRWSEMSQHFTGFSFFSKLLPLRGISQFVTKVRGQTATFLWFILFLVLQALWSPLYSFYVTRSPKILMLYLTFVLFYVSAIAKAYSPIVTKVREQNIILFYLNFFPKLQSL